MATLRVLVIDDTAGNREVVVELLQLYGIADVIGVDPAQEDVRAAVARHAPQAVVLDIAMVPEDGLSVASWLRAAYPAVRVVLFSAFEQAGALGLAVQETGAHAFLRKPFDADDLCRAVTGA
jgi:CheY-like chemotaxis protein